MRNISDQSCKANRNTTFCVPELIFFFEIRAVYEIMWENNVNPDRPQMTIWRMRIACYIPNATNT